MPPFEFAGDRSWGYNPAFPYAVESQLRRPRRPQGAGQGRPRARHRGAPGRGLQPPRSVGPGPVAVRRLVGGRQGRHLLLPGRALGARPGARPVPTTVGRRCASSCATTCMTVARRVPRRRAALGRHRLHLASRAAGRGAADAIDDGWDADGGHQRARRPSAIPGRLIIAEDLRSDPAVTRPPDEGGAGLRCPVGRRASCTRSARRSSRPSDEDAGRGRGRRRHRGRPADAFKRVIYTESHDEDRQRQLPRAGGDLARLRRQLAVPQARRARCRARPHGPGIPMLFQGQELIEGSWFSDEEPLDWSLRHRHEGLLQLHRDLIRLRRNVDDTTRGLRGPRITVHHVDQTARRPRLAPLGGGRSARRRHRAGQPLRDAHTPTIASGCRGRAAGGCASTATGRATTPSSRRSPRSTRTPIAEPLDGMPHSITVGVGPYTAVILSQDE